MTTNIVFAWKNWLLFNKIFEFEEQFNDLMFI